MQYASTEIDPSVCGLTQISWLKGPSRVTSLTGPHLNSRGSLQSPRDPKFHSASYMLIHVAGSPPKRNAQNFFLNSGGHAAATRTVSSYGRRGPKLRSGNATAAT